MSLLSEWVFDPIKSLINAGLAAAEGEIKHLAGRAAAAIPPTPVAQNILTGVEGGVQVVIDNAITQIVGELPVVGTQLSPEAVKLANEGLAYLETHANSVVLSLFSEAKAKLSTFSAS